ncbi:hypothetical protein AKJ45_01225 [candidate division MSBL1 archaeon SCGC-AAA261F19]|uniref:Protein AKJ45_01225 n=1 Tax=candidate division MSBL1 archaeon SCGC-AAA261F19 TaxID=1698275 RepID=A0A133VAX5_9EURY|nr:hypothetical protein AKJ45_01225 [candidate division MSBL1 archaeon SCGC-AAA261F19]
MLKLEEGEFLVKLARRSIETYLEEGRKPETPEVSDKLKQPRGVFVTLNKNKRLRGCIGRPLPNQPLVEGLIDAAISSATEDPRFPKVERKELEETKIEVSVLTPPKTIEAENPKEYPKKVEVGKDGLIAGKGIRKGLLLPQVPIEQNWDAEEFLSNTCLKAGLTPDAWLGEETKIQKFQAQIFTEKEPGGTVEERSFM